MKGPNWIAVTVACAVFAGALGTGIELSPGKALFGATAQTATATAVDYSAGDRNGVSTAHPSRPTPPSRKPTTPKPTTQPSAKPAAKPSPAVPAACARYTGNQQIACTLLPSYGFSYDQMPPLAKLWSGESNWRSTAENPSSGAYGIPQALPASKMASVAGDWRTNPATQIRWGLAYIKRTYGTPARAWATWLSRSPHWY